MLTKAELLEDLHLKIKSAKVLPQVRTSVRDWNYQPTQVMDLVFKESWSNRPLIVRSSSQQEDQAGQSMAGHYLSLLNVQPQTLKQSIHKVCQTLTNQNDQILIQPMLQNVAVSGVVFSRDPNTGAPYIVINYDDTTHSTSSVTSGTTNNLKTFYYYKAAPFTQIPALFKSIIRLIFELEEILSNNSLDVEFAIDDKGELYIFQVRPLVCVSQSEDISFHQKTLHEIKNKIDVMNKPHPYLFGEKTVFGVMPDWNPAEIIGVRPRPLALSLYKELITDNIWAYQRSNYGYKNLRSFPLLIHFGGLAYIDVRVSFNSFIPDDMSPAISSKLVDYYIDRLIESPMHHDKTEFEILFSCYTFDYKERAKKLSQYGFTKKEISVLKKSLVHLTNTIIHPEKGLWKKDIHKIHKLESQISKIALSNLDLVSKIYWLIEDCKRYGTLPFAGLARAGFIAMQMLNSLVTTGHISLDEKHRFLKTLNTVSSEIGEDFQSLNQTAFLEKYGHLRPGTYDILSERYDENPSRYFDWNKKELSLKKEKHRLFKLSANSKKSIGKLLCNHQINYDAPGLFNFIKLALEGREYAKFIFTKSLSLSLKLFKELAANCGLNPDDASMADIDCIKKLYSSSLNPSEIITHSIQMGKKNFAVTQKIILPPLITNSDQVFSFSMPSSEPNFITQGKIIGDVIGIHQKEKFKGNILFIPSADPGYDWIFSHNLGGFVTMYGGINSHMAIRAVELNLPAVIGAGEELFQRWSKGKTLEMDCSNKTVRILKK